ncbi:integrase, catalytic region, zinc finger, CCHC-type containing protein [Tanacetum coccineum]
MSNTNNNLQTQTSNALHNAIMEAGGKDRPPMLAPDNHIYSIVDACPNACEMWKAIERLKKVLTSITTRTAKNEVNKIRAERLACTANQLALVAQQQPVYHPQSSHTHYNQNSSTRSQQATTRNRGKAIVNSPQPTHNQEPDMVAEDDEMSKEKEIDNLMALISLSFKKIYKPTNNNLRTSSNTSRANQDNSPRTSRGTGYNNQRAVNVVGARETVGTQVVQKSRIQCYNCKEYRHVARECQKPKWEKDSAYHKEKRLLYKQKEAGIQLSDEEVDWRDDIDDEPKDQELEAHYLYMANIQKVSPDAADNFGSIFDPEPLQKVQYDDDNYNVFTIDRQHLEQPKSVNETYPDEQGDTNITTDMSTNGEEVDQDNDDDLAKERDLFASLIEKLKYEIDDSKNRVIRITAVEEILKAVTNAPAQEEHNLLLRKIIPWLCEETDPFTPRIHYFDLPKRTRMPSHVKTYDGSEDSEDHLKIFQAAAKVERWAMPTWCHMFNSTLTGSARVWFDDLPPESRFKIQSRDVKGAPEVMRISRFMHGITNHELIKRLHDNIPKSVDEMMRITTSFLRGEVAAGNQERKKSLPPWKQQEFGHKQILRKGVLKISKAQNNGKDQPKTNKKGETSSKDKALAILMVQPWQRVAKQRITQSFSPDPEISFPPLGEVEGTEGPMIIEAEIGGHFIHRMYVDGRDEEHSTSAWMNFVIVRSSSPYNGIIGRPGVRKIQAVLSTAHKMLKFPVAGGILTLKSSKIIPIECAVVLGLKGQPSAINQAIEERIKVAINPEYLEQTIMIGSTLTEEGRSKLYDLL